MKPAYCCSGVIWCKPHGRQGVCHDQATTRTIFGGIFRKTATEFEARFATEEDCRDYWIAARWGGKPACAKCASTRAWTIRDGSTFECADCGHQTSLTSGTLLEITRKPLKVWFRAVFEISTRRTGISAMDLQRILGFGSYETAWTWLHKLRALWFERIVSRLALSPRSTRRSSGETEARTRNWFWWQQSRTAACASPRRQQ